MPSSSQIAAATPSRKTQHHPPPHAAARTSLGRSHRPPIPQVLGPPASSCRIPDTPPGTHRPPAVPAICTRSPRTKHANQANTECAGAAADRAPPAPATSRSSTPQPTPAQRQPSTPSQFRAACPSRLSVKPARRSFPGSSRCQRAPRLLRERPFVLPMDSPVSQTGDISRRRIRPVPETPARSSTPVSASQLNTPFRQPHVRPRSTLPTVSRPQSTLQPHPSHSADSSMIGIPFSTRPYALFQEIPNKDRLFETVYGTIPG